jgi:hypothetical protein
LNDLELRDIGITRGEIEYFASNPSIGRHAGFISESGNPFIGSACPRDGQAFTRLYAVKGPSERSLQTRDPARTAQQIFDHSRRNA